MSDSAVKKDSALLTKSRRRGETAGNDLADAEKKIARAARSAQRLAQLSESQRAGETLDLFAEDAERANLQAQNTDIRQGTFEGFELPDVFLAAVQARVAPSAPSASSAPKRIPQADTAQPEPAQASFDEVASPDEPKASAMLLPPSDTHADRSPAALAATLIAEDRDGTTLLRHHPPESAPADLDRVRATAFADTIDALRAVLVEQRAVTTAHARHMKTMLTFIVCAMLLAVAANIAQTAVLLRMRHDNALQQNRVGQLMLEQQATLASLFDTNSANVGIARASAAVLDASPIEPDSAAAPANRPQHSPHRARHTAH
jgi:hypothetical protein